MLQRGRRDRALRGARLRIGVAVAAAAVTLGVAGCVDVQNVAGVSGTCTSPTTLHDGFFQNRTVAFRVATQPDPLNEKETWVCFRVKPASQPEQAGRIDVNPTTGVGAVTVTTDLSSRACASGPSNLIPPPHPIEQGEVLDTPFYIDGYATISGGLSAWVCVEAAGFKQRVLVNAPTVDDPDVVVNSDTAPPPMADTTPPPAALPSSACAENAFGTPTEHVNVHLNGRDLFLYTSRPADNEAHICARVSGTPSGGVRVSVKAAPSQIVDVQTSSDLSPCTQDVVVTSNPPVAIRMSPAGQTPPSVCVGATRHTIVTGPVPPIVSVARD
jgi:hypothetical protein